MVAFHATLARRSPREQKDQYMTANVSPRSWREWSMSTKLVVAAGFVAAAAVVAFLYVPMIAH
jgi:predicted membrane protein